MSNTIELETCPLCGSKLTSSNINTDLMHNLDQLKTKGVLEHTLITAVSIVQTMSDNNPAWLRDLLTEQKTDVKKILTENKKELAEYIDKKIATETKLQELLETLKTISESSGSNNESMIELVKSMEKQYRQETNKSLQKIMEHACSITIRSPPRGGSIAYSKKKDDYTKKKTSSAQRTTGSGL